MCARLWPRNCPAERLARADDTLDNTGPVSAICPQVSALDLRYRALRASARVAGAEHD
jgi:hypothetical protein